MSKKAVFFALQHRVVNEPPCSRVVCQRARDSRNSIDTYCQILPERLRCVEFGRQRKDIFIVSPYRVGDTSESEREVLHLHQGALEATEQASSELLRQLNAVESPRRSRRNQDGGMEASESKGHSTLVCGIARQHAHREVWTCVQNRSKSLLLQMRSFRRFSHVPPL